MTAPAVRLLSDAELKKLLPPKNRHIGETQILRLIAQERPREFARYFQAEFPPERNGAPRDESRDDAALVRLLVDYVGWDWERLHNLSGRSALYRPAWEAEVQDPITEKKLQLFGRTALRELRALAWRVHEGGSGVVAPLRLLSDAELDGAPDPEWLIAGLVLRDSLAVLFGPRNLGKSFLALDWALSVATGTTWRGHLVRSGPVIFLAAEGWAGFKRRVRAWKLARDFEGCAGVHFLSGVVNVLRANAVASLGDAIRTKLGETPPALIVVDTLSQSMPGGDENSPKDMGAAVANLQALRRATGATVLALHHPRRSDEEERGHSSLGNAADTMLRLGRADDGETCELVCTKQRDAEWFAPVRFRLRPVGESLVIDDAPATTAAGPGIPLSGALKKALDALADLIKAEDDPRGVTSGRWEKATGLEARTFSRAKAALIETGRVLRNGKLKSPSSRFRPAGTEFAAEELPF